MFFVFETWLMPLVSFLKRRSQKLFYLTGFNKKMFFFDENTQELSFQRKFSENAWTNVQNKHLLEHFLKFEAL